MATQLRYAIALVALLVGIVTSQDFSSNSNFVDEGNYDYADTQPQRPPPRTAPVSRPQQPSQSFARPNSFATAPKPTPVPILKQINRHNEDGSYTYGYEGADGSFKIETKLPTGEVMGKYGYVDDLGKVRVVEYGANKYGFQPAGEGITVAPPTLVDESTRRGPDGEIIQDDGSYLEEPAARPPPRAQVRPAPRPVAQAPRPAPRPAPAPIPQYEEPIQYTQSTFQSSQNFAPQQPISRPSFAAPPRSSFSQGPAPPRAQIPGAAPISGPEPAFSQPRPQPAPQRPPPQRAPQQFFSPAPVYESRPAPVGAPLPPQQPPRQNFARQASGGGGILDQLQRDYALPQGGSAPLHDISFGSSY